MMAFFVLVSVGCGRKKQDLETVTVWHWMTDRKSALEELAARYETQTGIKIKIDLFAPSNTYTHKVIASAQAKVLPDIFGILDKKEVLADFIKSGFVADLTESFKADNSAWENSFFSKALDNNRFLKDNVYGVKEGIYGVPLDVTNIQMLYNKNFLRKAGINKPPETFDEFLSAIAALKRIGISGMVTGWGELWLIDCFASNYAFNIMGEEKVMATYRGDVPYTDPDWIRVFSVFKTLKEHTALIEGVVTKQNKYAEQDFALERAAFAFNGSWCVNVYQDMNEDLQYGVMLPPKINPDQEMRIWGGAGSSFFVNNHSPRKEKAIAFLKWLTQEEQQVYLAQVTKNLPATKTALGQISEVLADFARGMNYTTHPTIWTLNEDAVVSETYLRGIQSIIIAEKTPEQVAKEVQAVKEKQIQKMKNRK